MSRTTPTLERAEWDFEKWAERLNFDLGSHALFCAYNYEFAREIPFLHAAVRLWRSGSQSDSFDDLLKHSEQVLALGFVRNFFGIRQWPIDPIQSVPIDEFKKYVRELMFPMPVSNRAKDEALAAIIDSDPKMRAWHTPRRSLRLSLPEAFTHDELVACFAAYLRIHFPQHQPRPVKQMKANLKALGAYRLLTKRGMTVAEAAHFTQCELGEALYQNEQAWSRAKKKANAVLCEFQSAAKDVIERQNRLRGKSLSRGSATDLPEVYG
jgi:hypothetical protein